jgi:ABC-2 type transport system permease protein
MRAIIRRELSAYFTSPIGYVYLGLMYFLSGYFLFTGVLVENRADLSPVFSALLMVVMFLTPILTMRLMAEDRRLRTDQALLTAPVSLGAIVGGKFFAAALVYTAGISITLVYALVINFLAPVNWAIVWGNYIALLLLGFAFISMGQFISSLTENQATAAIGGFALILGLLLLDAIPSMLPNPRVAAVLAALSLTRRFTPITSGILEIANLMFFLSVCGVFLFLSARVLEKRRWS